MPIAEYRAHLRAQGASEEDIKALTEGSFATAAVKAFDASVAAAAAETARIRAEADASIATYKANADKWYEEVATPALSAAQQAKIKSDAEAARLRSLVAQSQDEGLKAVAKEMGYDVTGGANNPPPNPNPGTPGFDPNKYFTRDEIVSIAAQEGEAIAVAQDIAFEHRQLFPDKPLNFRELRREALAAKKPVEQFWMERYGVTAARDKAAADAKAADEARIRKEERDKVTAEFAERQANPNLIPGTTSINPIAPRAAAGRDKQPWESGLAAEGGSGDRTQRAAKLFAERQTQGNVH